MEFPISLKNPFVLNARGIKGKLTHLDALLALNFNASNLISLKM